MTSGPEFLVSALRCFLGSDSSSFTEDVNFASLLQLADAHAVTPILYLSLRNTSLPPAFAGQLRSRFENSVRQSLAQTAELARLSALFDEHRIPFVALKGPMLSQYLYGELGTRSSGDIDVLVEPENVPRIRNILVSSGHRLWTRLHWSSDSACLRSREQEISFDSPSGVTIDVHWRLMPRYFASVFDGITGWESLRTVPLAGRAIQTLAPEPLLQFLCAHGAKHMFERLGWICDVARFLHVTPDFDWARITDQCRRTHTLRPLLLGVNLARELLGAPAPPKFDPDPKVKDLTRTIVDRLMSGARPPVPAIESTRYYLRLLETPAQRVRCLAGLYVGPSEAEFRALRLPPPLYFLYYPFRPLRLSWKHLAKRH
jgi:Uncharacterised nucleotidyltransferase